MSTTSTRQSRRGTSTAGPSVLPAELVDLLRHVVGELEAERAVQRLRWLLHRVGESLAVTSAGWLPPAVVTAATDELALDRQRIGKGNREDLTEPVRRLRQSAQRLGMLRVAKGRCCRRARAQRCARTRRRSCATFTSASSGSG